MKRLCFGVILAVISIMLLAEFAHGGDPDEFQKNVKEYSKKLEAARKGFEATTKRFNELRGLLQRMQPNDPDYRSTAIEHNKVLAERRKYETELGSAKNNLCNEIRSFLQDNNRQSVETTLKIFYKGSSYPDLAVEQELMAALKKITDGGALDYLVSELKSSKRKNLRKLICEVIADKTEKKFVDALISTLDDRNWDVVVAAARALAQNRAKAAVEPMIAAYEKAQDKNDEGAVRGLRQALQDMTGEYMLETARDFRNWWNGKGRESYNENETARPRGLMDKGGPRTSLLYGEITSKKVVFICDVSHSMSARGRVPGEPVDKSRQPGDDTPETGGDLTGKKGPKRDRRGLGGQGVQPGYVGMRIDILKIELAHVVISLLPEDAKFNLVTYSTEVKTWKSKLAKATKSNREAALDFVKKMNPIGMTNTYGALEAAFSDKAVDTIYFLSDGNPTTGTTVSHDEILTAVRRWNQGRNVNIHTIGLLVGKYGNEDSDKLKSFLKSLASQNGGECRVFEDK